MRLVIQIPCLDEAQTLPATIGDLPTSLPDIDEIRIIVIDDGSSDESGAIAASLGASNLTVFRRVVLPTLMPAILSGGGLAFARAIGEYGSVVLIGGNIPGLTQVASQYIQQQIEIDRPLNAAAVSVALLAIAFVTLLLLRVVSSRSQRREERDA